MRPLLALCSQLAVLALAGCAAQVDVGRLCPEGCETGKTCVVGRCRSADESPSPSDTLRVVLDPVELAVIASGDAPGDGLPETLALGRAKDGTVELLLRFAAPFRDNADVMSAFIVLDPLESAPPSAHPISFEMARILDPWQPSTVTWGRQPRFDLPRRAGIIRALPTAKLRVDVTSLVRDWGKRLPDDHGIALLVRGDDATGQAYAMGTTSGVGPRLEVYVR